MSKLGDSAARRPCSRSDVERQARGFAPPSCEGFALFGASICSCEALHASGVSHRPGPLLGYQLPNARPALALQFSRNFFFMPQISD